MVGGKLQLNNAPAIKYEGIEVQMKLLVQWTHDIVSYEAMFWSSSSCVCIGWTPSQTPYISFFDLRVLWKKIPVGGLYT